MKAVDEIATVRPSFISVTYGAGGGTSKNTVGIASHIQNELHVRKPCTSDLRVLDESGGA
ncbi:MAG: methylenetetrahydrofolate reductase [Sellimonas intestinalis]